MIEASTFEKLGVFYLGTPVSPDIGASSPEPFLYNSKDLTTHAFCVGMTGSGKTGLCVTLLEEAAIDGIPAIAIDPKGDLGNLLLTFPELRPADFRPWIDESEAARNERSPDEQATWTADLWKKGLAESGQDGARVGRFKSAVETAIYTPGSRVGRPLRVLGTLDAPSEAVRNDPDALRDRVVGMTSSLLTLLGIDADPVQSREHIVIARILSDCWEKGEDLDLGSLIRTLQNPPFERVGVIDLESYFPAKDRFALATTLNNLLASPGFASWMEGEPLDVGKLLYTAEGKPRLSVLSIAHLSERERMFFVTLLLGEVVSWMRSQEGTGSLRALLFMDEIFGYFPPLGNPPAKPLMLTLLKQARAYGLGVVLATQNPVDIDYKGLSNCGTWFLGRLQTERDKARVLEGLEGASQTGFDRKRVDELLSGLGKRMFLMNNVHEDGPALFETRWALSYLRGPLQRDEIRKLSESPDVGAAPVAGETTTRKAGPAKRATKKNSRPQRPLLPAEAGEAFFASPGEPPEAGALYEPGLVAEVSVHYVRSRGDVDHWETTRLYTPLINGRRGSPWSDETEELTAAGLSFAPGPVDDAEFQEPPAAVSNPKSYARWSKMLASHIYKERPLTILHCKKLKAYSRPGESEGEFRGRLAHKRRELRDKERAAIEKRYAPKLGRLVDRKRRFLARVDREREQYENRRMETVISWGSTLLGAVFGRKMGGLGTARRASTAAKGISRTVRERGDIGRAEAEVEAVDEQIAELDREFREKLDDLTPHKDGLLEIEENTIRSRKSDLSVSQLRFVWRA
ncbi:MAG: ATP-binding protein [Candidatus Binatia bacterium]|nr:ATP-binding protein [Candidatus Binatia bacterium]